MGIDERPLSELLSAVVDNRGRTCPTVDSGIPLIATNCVRDELLYPTHERARFVSKDTYETWFRGHPLPGDILFVNKATPGRVCLVPERVDFCIAQDMVALRADAERVYPRYLFAALRAPSIKVKIAQMHVGTLIPHFKKGDFDKLVIPLPDQGIQRFVGDTYFAFSAKIDLNRRMCQTLEEMARALFKSWFVDFDPVRAKMEGRDPGLPKEIADLFPSRLIESELGPIPEGWRVADFGTIACQSRDLAQSEGLDARTNYIGLEHMPRRSIALANWGTGEAVESSKFRFTAGDILFGKLRPYFHKVGVAPIDGVCSTDIVVARPSTPELFGITIGVMSSDSFVAHTDRSSAGTRMPRTNWADMSAFRIVTPSRDVAEVHTRAVKSMVDRIVLCIHESRTLAALRDTLLPKLISGELRVPASLGSMQEVST